MLTAKEEKFSINVFNGMTLTDAYKDAYDSENMSDKTINEKACILAKKDKIRTRIQELRDKANDKAIMSAIERKKWLTKVINGEIKEESKYYDDHEVVIYEKDADIGTKIKALDTLNKMEGEYTTKIEGNISVEKLEDLL